MTSINSRTHLFDDLDGDESLNLLPFMGQLGSQARPSLMSHAVSSSLPGWNILLGYVPIHQP